jgi:hypothetical protein
MTTKTAPTSTPTLLSVVASARAELHALLQRGIDLAEQRSKAVFRLARSLSRRVGGGGKGKTKRRG